MKKKNLISLSSNSWLRSCSCYDLGLGLVIQPCFEESIKFLSSLLLAQVFGLVWSYGWVAEILCTTRVYSMSICYRWIYDTIFFPCRSFWASKWRIEYRPKSVQDSPLFCCGFEGILRRRLQTVLARSQQNPTNFHISSGHLDGDSDATSGLSYCSAAWL